MSSDTHEGYLVLADISGYTRFLVQTELDHAQAIIQELLELVSTHLAPLLTVVKREGDTLFAYAAPGRFARGELLLELLEATYAAFRDRLRSIPYQTTCTCAACRAVDLLDLKFLAHYGQFRLSTVAGSTDLFGLDIQVLRRLKGAPGRGAGPRAYARLTEACRRRAGLEPGNRAAAPLGDADLGEVPTYVWDLAVWYEAHRVARQEGQARQRPDLSLAYAFPAPPPVVWDWLNDPAKRGQWWAGTHWRAGNRPAGRTGVGASNHCTHGSGTARETILVWEPFTRLTSRMEQTGVMPLVSTSTLRLTATASGTRMEYQLWLHLPGPRGVRQALGRLLYRPMLYRQWNRLVARLGAADSPSPAANPTGTEAVIAPTEDSVR